VSLAARGSAALALLFALTGCAPRVSAVIVLSDPPPVSEPSAEPDRRAQATGGGQPVFVEPDRPALHASHRAIYRLRDPVSG